MKRNMDPIEGRTSKAYKHQPSRAKWKCGCCDGARATAKRNGEKTIPDEVSFSSKEKRDVHLEEKHS